MYAQLKIHSFYTIGRLVVVSFFLAGLGRAANMTFATSGACIGLSWHSTVSITLYLIALLAGIGYAGYHNLFVRYLGMPMVNDMYCYRVVEMAFPHVQDILDEKAKNEMKELLSSELVAGNGQLQHRMGAGNTGLFSVRIALL